MLEAQPISLRRAPEFPSSGAAHVVFFDSVLSSVRAWSIWSYAYVEEHEPIDQQAWAYRDCILEVAKSAGESAKDTRDQVSLVVHRDVTMTNYRIRSGIYN